MCALTRLDANLSTGEDAALAQLQQTAVVGVVDLGHKGAHVEGRKGERPVGWVRVAQQRPVKGKVEALAGGGG